MNKSLKRSEQSSQHEFVKCINKDLIQFCKYPYKINEFLQKSIFILFLNLLV